MLAARDDALKRRWLDTKQPVRDRPLRFQGLLEHEFGGPGFRFTAWSPTEGSRRPPRDLVVLLLYFPSTLLPMPTTFYSMSLMTASESWRSIRTVRAEPQGSLARVLRGDKSRKREFHMALEQAQQQFAAAERIGYESRPLNLFYGLSQAGRAIAAGSPLLGRGTNQQWQANGHGLKYDIKVPTGVLATPIKQDHSSRDLFSRVSTAVGSPLDFNAIDFGAAMNQLVDYTMAFQEPEGFARPITDAHVFNVQGLTFPLELEIRVPDLTNGLDATAEEVRGILSQYPALRDLEVALGDEGSVRWSHNEGHCFVIVSSSDQLKSRDGSVSHLDGTEHYRRTAVLLPRAGDSEQALRPLMAWWGVLYALSMLARYAPSRWTETLSLPDSPIASKIEFLLDSAVDAVPELLWSELSRLSDHHG